MSVLDRVRSRPATTSLAAWSLLVWTTRIRNIWGDGSLSTGDKVGSTALALSFTVLAVAALVTIVRSGTSRRAATLAADLLAAWTVGVWAVRMPAILLHDHEAAFKVVHLVLAVVSVALAALAAREAHRARPAADDPAPAAAPAEATAG